jgi:hypothetical protein
MVPLMQPRAKLIREMYEYKALTLDQSRNFTLEPFSVTCGDKQLEIVGFSKPFKPTQILLLDLLECISTESEVAVRLNDETVKGEGA